jgi:hypothetical protein
MRHFGKNQMLPRIHLGWIKGRALSECSIDADSPAPRSPRANRPHAEHLLAARLALCWLVEVSTKS